MKLDETGVRRERLRKRLTIAGLSWFGGLTWLVALIAGSVAGGGEPTEGLVVGVTFGSGTIASIALLLAGDVVGRPNADWWQPRLKEALPGDVDPTDGDGRMSQRASRRKNERRAKRRYSRAEQVRSQIRATQIYERRRDGDGTLLGEPILVLNRSRRGVLGVFDQEGNELGSVVRVLDGTSKSEGGVWTAEIRDIRGETVLAVRLAPRRRRRWRKDTPIETGVYGICSADGKHLATIGPSKTSDKRTHRAVTAADSLSLLAHIDEQTARWTVATRWTVADAERRKIGEIVCPSGIDSQPGWYVATRNGAVGRPLSSVILAACVVWDDTRTDSS